MKPFPFDPLLPPERIPLPPFVHDPWLRAFMGAALLLAAFFLGYLAGAIC